MIFSEKLQLIRKNKGVTQEQLAEKLDVSRQAVAKWESGQVYPDINNLIQISNLFHVTVDYLVRDQECTVACIQEENADLERLIEFQLEANRNTYAGCSNETDSTRQDSHDYSYSDENTIGIVECILLLVSIFLTENTLKKTLNDDGTHK